MKKILILFPVAVLILAGCISQTPAVNNQTSGGGASVSTVGQKFSDQLYYGNAYLISGDTLSAEAQRALSGFQMDKKAMPDGTTVIILKALEPQYHDQQYTLNTGEQLYFIDTMLFDDNGGERTINDDTAVVVDSNGFVVQPPPDWSK